MESLRSVCRVCLQYNPESNSFFDEVEYENNIKLAEVFRKVADVEVAEYDDGKPCHLCSDCTERLLNAYDFIGSVERSEIYIDSFLNDENQKVEEIEGSDDDLKMESTEVEIQDIEVLDEEFQVDQEQLCVTDSEVVVVEEVSAEPIVMVFDNNTDVVPTNETRRADDAVGSRLSKRLSSSHYKCSCCQRSFAKLETLDRHIKAAHTTISAEELANISTHTNNASEDKQISCSYCPQMFKRRNNHIRHLKAAHPNEFEELSDEDKKLIKSRQNYKRGNCPYCGKNFSNGSLIVHIRRHTGENPYQCDQCEKGFPRRQDLVVHQRKHTGEKPHICTICGKSFSRANKLARHMRVHTGERPYKCTKCLRSFAQSNDLKIHMRRHTGEKPYKCSVCLEAFICGAQLKTHKRQKNHHCPSDEYDDPFASWRVSKREFKTNDSDKRHTNIIDEEVNKDEGETKNLNLELMQIMQE